MIVTPLEESWRREAPSCAQAVKVTLCHAGGITENETEVIWKFDKRLYSEKPPPRNMEDPPPVVDNDLARLIIKMFNQV